MRLEFTSDKAVKLTAENPDESIKKVFLKKIEDALWSEIKEFLEDVSVTMRRLAPGQAAVVESKPIVVTLEKPAAAVEESVLTAQPGKE